MSSSTVSLRRRPQITARKRNAHRKQHPTPSRIAAGQGRQGSRQRTNRHPTDTRLRVDSNQGRCDTDQAPERVHASERVHRADASACSLPRDLSAAKCAAGHSAQRHVCMCMQHVCMQHTCMQHMRICMCIQRACMWMWMWMCMQRVHVHAA